MSAKEEHEKYAKNLATRVEAVMDLYAIIPKTMPQGSIIQVEREDGSYARISKKQLKTKKDELLQEIRKGLPKKFKQAGKRTRKIEPSDFKNVYTPVIVADAVREFVNAADFGRVDPMNAESGKLMDELVFIQRGYGLRNSFQLLWYICVYANGLRTPEDKTLVIPNDVMTEAFEGVPACYINYINEEGKMKKKVNEENLSTFEVLEHRVSVLEEKEEPFDRTKFKSYFFATILSINEFKPTDLPLETRDTLKREDIKTQLLREFEIIKNAKEKWKEVEAQKVKPE